MTKPRPPQRISMLEPAVDSGPGVVAPVPIATRAIVSAPRGKPATLTLYSGSGDPVGTLMLAPTHCVVLARDLLIAARSRGVQPGRLGIAEMKATPVRVWTPQYELFCQARARGLSLAESDRYAGWSGCKSHGFKVTCRPNVRARIAEIQAELAQQGAAPGQSTRAVLSDRSDSALQAPGVVTCSPKKAAE
jgi:hypothetical protein